MEYMVKINREAKEIWVHGITKNGNKFSFLIVNENGLIKYVGNKPLDLYRKKVFTGGEWLFFEKQETSFKYILK